MAHRKRLSGQARLGAVTKADVVLGHMGLLKREKKRKKEKKRKGNKKARYSSQRHHPRPAINPARQHAIDTTATEQPGPASSLVEALNLGRSPHCPHTRTDAGFIATFTRPGPPDTHLSPGRLSTPRGPARPAQTSPRPDASSPQLRAALRLLPTSARDVTAPVRPAGTLRGGVWSVAGAGGQLGTSPG